METGYNDDFYMFWFWKIILIKQLLFILKTIYWIMHAIGFLITSQKKKNLPFAWKNTNTFRNIFQKMAAFWYYQWKLSKFH